MIWCCDTFSESISVRRTYRLSSLLSVAALTSTQERFRREKVLSAVAVAPQDTPGLHRKLFIQEVSAAAGHGAFPAII